MTIFVQENVLKFNVTIHDAKLDNRGEIIVKCKYTHPSVTMYVREGGREGEREGGRKRVLPCASAPEPG